MTKAANLSALGTNTSSSGVLEVLSGGTGQTTANAAFNALAPSQTSNTGKYLTTNGTDTSWATVTQTTFSAGTTGFTPNTATSGTVTLAGTLNIANGGTGTSTAFTTGSVVFAGASGTYTQDNANLFWDDTNNRLGIGTTSPTGALDITKSTNGNAFVVNALGGSNPNFTVQGSGEQTFRLYNSASTGSTRTSVKLASRLNTDWEWIAYTDAAGTGINDLTIANLAGTALSIDASRNLKFDSGYGSAATAYGCRAWVNFNGTGTVAIRASGNVTSITDLGTGYYQINFTTAIIDGNYCTNVTGSVATSSSTPVPAVATNTAPATTNVRITFNIAGSGQFDQLYTNVAIFR